MTEVLQVAQDGYDAISYRRRAAHSVAKERYPVPEGASGEDVFKVIAVRGLAMAGAERLLIEVDGIMDATLAAQAEGAARQFARADFETRIATSQPQADALIAEALNDAYAVIAREESDHYFEQIDRRHS